MTDKATFIGTSADRVCAWLRGPEYPGGEMIITGARPVENVPLTREVLLLEKSGRISRMADKTAVSLTRVKGIAEKTAAQLAELGVKTLVDLANLSGKDYQQELVAAFGSEKLDAWVADAVAKLANSGE